MTIYVVLMTLVIILGLILEKKNKKIYSVIVCILFTLVAALRSYNIGNDTLNYILSFNNVLQRFELYGFNAFSKIRFENGYILLMLIFRTITANYTIYFIFVHAFINYSFCRFIRKNSDNMCFSFTIFFLLRFFFSEMNIMRQFIAIAIFLFAIDCIIEKKLLKYITLIITASLFHKSALFLLPVYSLDRIQLNRKQKIIFIMASLIIYTFLYSILLRIVSSIGVYEGYFEEFYNSNEIGSLINFIMQFTIFIFVSILIKNTETKEMEKLLYKLLFLNTIVSFLCIRISILSRIAEYLNMTCLVLIPNTISKFKKDNMRMFLKIIITILCALYFFVISYYRPNWNDCIPYRFFFES